MRTLKPDPSLFDPWLFVFQIFSLLSTKNLRLSTRSPMRRRGEARTPVSVTALTDVAEELEEVETPGLYREFLVGAEGLEPL
jgi:hypothetical protein